MCFNATTISRHLINVTFTGTPASYLEILNYFGLKADRSPFIQAFHYDSPITWGRYISTRDNTMLDLEPTPGSYKAGYKATPSMTNGNGFGIFFMRGSQEGKVETTATTILLKSDGKMYWQCHVSAVSCFPIRFTPPSTDQLILTYAALNSLSLCMRNSQDQNELSVKHDITHDSRPV